MADTRIHPETGKELHREVRQQTVQVGSLSCTVDVPGWYPNDDSDAIHSGADLKPMNQAFVKLRGEYGAHVRSVRKRLKLTQEEAGILIGGGKRAFSKYEGGRTPPSDAAVGLIEVLSRHPEEIETLRKLRHVSVEEKPANVKGMAVARSGGTSIINRGTKTGRRKVTG